MTTSNVTLTDRQRRIMGMFYQVKATQVLYKKNLRNILWKKATQKDPDIVTDDMKKNCPALLHQIEKSYNNGNNIQSAVFSECVYAQTLADMLGLICFRNCENNTGITQEIERVLKSNNISPRYVYCTDDKSRMLIQAGGCNGTDCALLIKKEAGWDVYTIEFKEPGAKTSEPDLPKYKEDGILVVNQEFLKEYPQFKDMLDEQKGLDFFNSMGNNIHNFSAKSIETAVTNNYSNTKLADVICTEDTNGNLVMIPANQAAKWAELEGEIRPAGRNHYQVWTPEALKRFLKEKGASVSEGIVTVAKSKLDVRKARGGAGKISGYKITPLFFVYLKDCSEKNGLVTFRLSKVQQLNPTIAGKMFFKNLVHSRVKNYYGL